MKGEVVNLGIRKKDETTVVEVVSKYRTKCMHERFVVDERLEKVECADCGEKLNPIHALITLANQESRLLSKVERLRAEAEYLKTRRWYTCGGCGIKNDITVKVRYRAKNV